jgi:hypothetical protein
VVKKGTKRPRTLAKPDRFPLIDRELRKRTKADLIAMILRIAKKHTVVARAPNYRDGRTQLASPPTAHCRR